MIVNGKKVINETIQSGDLIQVGDAVIKFGFKKPEFQNPLPDRALLLIDANEVKSIFDYRPPVKEALEVVYSWNGVILNVEHFTDQTSVSVGGSSNEDFLVPSSFASGGIHQLATKSGRDWLINIDSKMTGVLYLKGQLSSPADARGPVTLGENDFVKLESGGIAFYLSQTIAPPVMKKQAAVITDGFFVKILLSSFAFTAFLYRRLVSA